jgi:hypothetical protein
MAETDEYVIEGMNTTTEYTPTDPTHSATTAQPVCSTFVALMIFLADCVH